MITKDLDQIISLLILQSLAENFIYTCMGLINFNGTEIFYTYVIIIKLFVYLPIILIFYFSVLICRHIISIVFDIGITYCIISFVSSINIESKLPKYVLYSVPPESYGIEVITIKI